ncbi:hypothetical protein J6590_055739 [Homalodisca vitripennis]|nr:hypothetical protein J6590_055739 [Homalodisca vitripennis]
MTAFLFLFNLQKEDGRKWCMYCGTAARRHKAYRLADTRAASCRSVPLSIGLSDRGRPPIITGCEEVTRSFAECRGKGGTTGAVESSMTGVPCLRLCNARITQTTGQLHLIKTVKRGVE